MENISIDRKNDLFCSIVVSVIISENPEYMRNSYYDLSIDNDVAEILKVENVFEKVSPQLLCCKLVHDISLMSAFVINYIRNFSSSIQNPSSKTKKLFLRLSISPEGVNIIQKRGFGLFVYNVDDMAYALYKFYDGVENLLKRLRNDEKYEFLDVILENYHQLFGRNPDEIMTNFINNNQSFYKKQIMEVEKILNEDN